MSGQDDIFDAQGKFTPLRNLVCRVKKGCCPQVSNTSKTRSWPLDCNFFNLEMFQGILDCHSFNLTMLQGICSKCQPSAVTLNRQPWRHTDSVMFENSQLVDRFVGFAGVQNLSLPAILRLSLPIPSQPAISRLSLPGSFSFGEKVVLSALAGSMAGARNPLAFKLS